MRAIMLNAHKREWPRTWCSLLAVVAGCSITDDLALSESSSAVTASFRNASGGYSGTIDGIITSQGGGNGARDFTSTTGLIANVTAGPYEAEALIRFTNLSLPAGATVTSASVTLTFEDWYGGNVLRGYYVVPSWVSSSVGWTHRDSTNLWNTAGAKGSGSDRSATEAFSDTSWTASGDVVKTYTLDPSVVQDWVDTPSTNNGLILTNTVSDKFLRVHTSESSTESKRPLLTVEYTTSGGGGGGSGSTFATTMAGLAPVGWWRLGEPSGTTAADSSGNGHSGVFNHFSAGQQGVAGAISGDSDGAIAVSPGATSSCTDSPFVSIGDHDDFSLVKTFDSFDRTAQTSGWGTSMHGEVWTPEVSSGGYSTTGTMAKITQSSFGTWQIGNSFTRKDVDVQIKASWSQAAAGAAITPVMIIARRVDASNYYRADLRESVGGQLQVRVIRQTAAGGTVTIIPYTTVGTYSVGAWWYLRLQLDGAKVRVAAAAENSPSTILTATDSSPLLSAGTISIRSTNSGSSSNPVVSFDDFRVQSIGLTVHAFMKPSTLDFNPEYIHWMGKGDVDHWEWAARLYRRLNTTRPNRLSGYIWNPDGAQGAGAYYGDSVLQANTWYEVVIIYDPGDKLDTDAGVTLYVNGVCRQGKCGGSTPSATTYATYQIVPANETSPLRIGTRACNDTTPAGNPTFFTGAIDEVAVFDRVLSETEIASLWNAH